MIAMRFAACKQKIKAIAVRLSMAGLALAMGVGVTGAIFHPGLFDLARPSASASVLITDGDAMSPAHGKVIESQKLITIAPPSR
jgi:hypothetical protein